MTVVILTACPAGLRGHLTQWLLELSAGVYVGHISARVRNRLWFRILEMSGNGRALMVYQTRSEQRLSFKVHNHHWTPVDVDGLTLLKRPGKPMLNAAMPTGWSKAARRRRFGRPSQARPQNRSGDFEV